MFDFDFNPGFFEDFDPAEGESKTNIHIVDNKNMSKDKRQRWEEIKRNAEYVEFEEIKD